jgi:hypothetical protein
MQQIKTFQELLLQAIILKGHAACKSDSKLFLDVPIRQYAFFIQRLSEGATITEAYQESLLKDKT